MTPKEKAKELYFDFSENLWYSTEEDKHLNAKQCAIIAVDEILNEYWSHDTKRRDWWKEVKQEIKNL